MDGVLLRGSCQLKRLAAAAGGRVDIHHVGLALRQGACFIERGGTHPGEHLQDATVFDDDVQPCG